VYASPKTVTLVVTIEQIVSTITIIPYLPMLPQIRVLYHKICYISNFIIEKATTGLPWTFSFSFQSCTSIVSYRRDF
jgi:hypothetical protein